MTPPGGRTIQPPVAVIIKWERQPLWGYARLGCAKLDHAKHDCANKGEGDIRGKDAQLADESHGKAPLVNVAARNGSN